MAVFNEEYSKTIEDLSDFDTMFDQDDSLVDLVEGFDSDGTPKTGDEYAEISESEDEEDDISTDEDCGKDIDSELDGEKSIDEELDSSEDSDGDTRNIDEELDDDAAKDDTDMDDIGEGKGCNNCDDTTNIDEELDPKTIDEKLDEASFDNDVKDIANDDYTDNSDIAEEVIKDKKKSKKSSLDYDYSDEDLIDAVISGK